MSKNTPASLRSDEDFADKLVKVGGAVISFALGVALIYLFWFHKHQISNDPGDWGAFGDYIGGLVNPAVGLATVILVIFSINIQRRELRASLNAMRQANEAAARMSFEQSLFAWLENYHSQIREIEVGKHKGRKFLIYLYEYHLSPLSTIRFFNRGSQKPPETDSEANQIYMAMNPNAEVRDELAEIQFRVTLDYTGIYLRYRTDLDAPFRTLYRLLRWIDESSHSDAEKWHYCTLVRSQISWAELVLLYYNGLIREGEKLAIYANKYALFDNLLTSDELIRFATQELTRCPSEVRPRVRDGNAPWPYSESAFNSSKARKNLGLPENN